MEKLILTKLNIYYNKKLKNITEQDGGWSARAFKLETTDGLFFFKIYDKQRLSTNIWTTTIDTYMPVVVWLSKNTELTGRIVCPILTNTGDYKCEDENYIYILFPFINGYTLCDKPMNHTQVREIAEILGILHKYNAELPIDTTAIKEDYKLPFCDDLEKILKDINNIENNETVIILKEYKQKLINTIENTRLLAQKLKNQNLPLVLCHTDVHGWNLMQSDRLILIDWEGMKLAPPEADLFAFINDLFWHKCSDEFLETYKKINPCYEINAESLCFYQSRRRIEDICAFAQSLLYENNDDEETKLSLVHLRRECNAI